MRAGAGAGVRACVERKKVIIDRIDKILSMKNVVVIMIYCMYSMLSQL